MSAADFPILLPAWERDSRRLDAGNSYAPLEDRALERISWQGAPMPWIRAQLKGNSVFARVNDQGEFVVDKGRVEVRYRAQDGKVYRASPGNLVKSDATLLPDSTCAQGTEAPSSSSTPAVKSGQTAWEAWTDGACSGNPGPAGLGVVLMHGSERWEISEFLGTATNNIAELTAILRAVERVPDSEDLAIFTDSKYSIGVLQKGWKAKANQELIASIRTQLGLRKRTILQYTPGHAGVALNERADALARMACGTRSSSVIKTS